MKCRIFTYDKTDDAMSNTITAWLEENPDIKILHTAQSSASVSNLDPQDGEYVETTLTIFYE